MEVLYNLQSFLSTLLNRIAFLRAKLVWKRPFNPQLLILTLWIIFFYGKVFFQMRLYWKWIFFFTSCFHPSCMLGFRSLNMQGLRCMLWAGIVHISCVYSKQSWTKRDWNSSLRLDLYSEKITYMFLCVLRQATFNQI